MEPEFISKVWMKSNEKETPIEAITRLLCAKGQVFISPDPSIHDIFASGYCMDSYFLWDHQSAGFMPEVYARYGGRAVAESFELHAGDGAKAENSLDHLACHYYRFYLDSSVAEFRIDIQSPQPQSNILLKAEIAVVTESMARGLVEPLRPQPSNNTHLAAELKNLNPKKIDHLVLVVTNCGTREMQRNPNIPHDDEQKYTLEVTVS